jgi:hypothetical protein
MCPQDANFPTILLTDRSLLLHLQVRPDHVDGSSPDQVCYYLMTELRPVVDFFRSGAQVVFHSFLQPVVGRFFSSNGTSSNLRAQAEAASKPHST